MKTLMFALLTFTLAASASAQEPFSATHFYEHTPGALLVSPRTKFTAETRPGYLGSANAGLAISWPSQRARAHLYRTKIETKFKSE